MTEYLVWVAFRPNETCFGYSAKDGYGWPDLNYMPLAITGGEEAASAVVDALELQFKQDVEEPQFYWNPATDYRPEEFLHYQADVRGYGTCRIPGADGAAASWISRALLLAAVAGGKPVEGNGKRGRPKDPFTRLRADHAKRHVEGEGRGWREAFSDYRQQEPEDTAATLNKYRKAYERLYPPK